MKHPCFPPDSAQTDQPGSASGPRRAPRCVPASGSPRAHRSQEGGGACRPSMLPSFLSVSSISSCGMSATVRYTFSMEHLRPPSADALRAALGESALRGGAEGCNASCSAGYRMSLWERHVAGARRGRTCR